MTFNNPFRTLLGGAVEDDANVSVNVEVPKEQKRVTGKIIKVEGEKGWGFISSKEIKFERIFFHWSSLRQDTLRFPQLKNGMNVEFTPVETEDKGIRAIQIKVLDAQVKN